MFTTLNEVSDEFTRTGAAQLSGVVLLLNETGLRVNHQTQSTNFLAPVDGVALSIEQNQETAISERTSSNHRPASVEVECPEGERRSRGGEGVSDVFVDEVDAEDGLEHIASRDLTLVENTLVLVPAGFRREVSFGDCTANDGECSIGSLGSEFVANEGVEPASGDGVLLEGLQLQKLDEVLDRSPEVTTNAQLLESDDHVLATFTTVFSIGEDVTKLRVSVLVETTGAAN
jgi:hypothetical protein